MAIHYARRGSAHLAYRAVGDSPIDLLYYSSLLLSIDSVDEEPHVARFHRRLSSFARVIELDPRGLGLSDAAPGDEPFTLDLMVRDIVAVLDAIGSEQTAIVAGAGAGPIAITLAAQVPERIRALILVNAYARLIRSDDYPIGYPAEFVESFLQDNPDPDTEWSAGGSDDVAFLAPSLATDPRFRAWLDRAGPRGASPAAARRFLTLNSLADVRDLLPALQVPTLVLCRRDDAFVPAGHSRYMAEHIPGAKLVELPGNDHFPFSGDADAVLDEIEEFLTGRRHGSADRVLTTVLVTDIVDSTRRAAELGDAAWRAELDAHDALVRTQLVRFVGREVNTTGDGFVASFDSPTQAVRCAAAIAAAAEVVGLSVRLGIHTGECERRGDDLAGLAVHIAARVASIAGAGEVVVSRTVCDLVTGSELQFVPRGEHELKGVPQPWQLFALET